MNQMFEFKFTVQTSDIDTMGHVNNARYFDYFEKARWAIHQAGGYSPQAVKKMYVGPVILETTVKFKRELTLGQAITIKSQCVEYHGKVGLLHQTMSDSESNLLCEAYFKIGLMDLNKRKLIQPPEEWIKAIGVAIT